MKNGKGPIYWWFACVVEGEHALRHVQRAAIEVEAANLQSLEYDPTCFYGAVSPKKGPKKVALSDRPDVKAIKKRIAADAERLSGDFDITGMPENTGRALSHRMIAIWAVLNEFAKPTTVTDLYEELRRRGISTKSITPVFKIMHKRRLISKHGNRWSAKYA